MLLLLGSCMQDTHVGYGSATQQQEWASAMLAACDVHAASAVPGCSFIEAGHQVGHAASNPTLPKCSSAAFEVRVQGVTPTSSVHHHKAMCPAALDNGWTSGRCMQEQPL